jgi:hypothetical protein
MFSERPFGYKHHAVYEAGETRGQPHGHRYRQYPDRSNYQPARAVRMSPRLNLPATEDDGLSVREYEIQCGIALLGRACYPMLILPWALFPDT